MASHVFTGDYIHFGELLSKPTVTVKVGEKDKEFRINKGLARKYTQWFRHNPIHSRRCSQGILHLSEITTKDFESFVYWLYTQQMPPLPEDDDGDIIVRLYVTAHRLSAPKLKDFVIDEYTRRANAREPTLRYKTLVDLSVHLESKDPFWRLLVDVCCKYGRVPCEDEDEQPPYIFLTMLAGRYADLSCCRGWLNRLHPSVYKEGARIELSSDEQVSSEEDGPQSKKRKR